MATKTRHKSPSPAPAPIAPLMMTSAIPSAPNTTNTSHSSLASTLSKDMFPSPPRTDPAQQQQQRRSELAILNYHNARPSGQSSIILPPASALAANEGHMLGEQPAAGTRGFELPPPQSHIKEEYLPFGWKTEVVSHERHQQPSKEMETSRNLSIQSLISASAPVDHSAFENGGERGMKRKGSDIIDRDDDAMTRSSRGTSVISTTGLSMEDPDVRDAVEALGGLKADFAHPLTAPNSPPNRAIQQEPLLNLIQSSASSVHPLLSTALSISSSAYGASKNYIPPFRYVAESAENVAAPVVRRTGLENYIRRGLTRHRSNNDKSEPNGGEKKRRKSEKEPTPAAPEKQLVEVQSGRERGWQTRLYYSSTGLATALSDESRRSLKYCLKILLAANGNLVKVIATLTNVVDELDQYLSQKQGVNPTTPTSSPPGVAGYLSEGYEQRRQHLAETVDRLKDEALKTLKVVVDTISRYAGGALPEQARNVVKRQLLSFPLKWQAATCGNSAGDVEQGVAIAEPDDDTGRRTKGKAVRVLMMAREGLEMMRGVAEVVDGTLVSAEEWCERFGKKTDGGQDQEMHEKGERKRVSWMDAPTANEKATATPERESDGDVSMAKAG